MDESELRPWFDRYMAVFAAHGRGEAEDLRELLDYFAVPLLVTTDEAVHVLPTDEQVLGFAGQMVEGMRATGYDHTDTLASAVTELNATSALYRTELARRRADGSDLGVLVVLVVTYLVVRGAAGSRIAAMAVEPH